MKNIVISKNKPKNWEGIYVIACKHRTADQKFKHYYMHCDHL